MPLDPQAKQVLDLIASSGVKEFSQSSVAEARLGMEAFAGARSVIEPVAHVDDRRVPGPAGELPVRVYRPESSTPLPVLVYFHGGGWVVGSLATHDGICRALANAVPCVVVSVDYRLAPEHPYPAAVDDCYAATVWVAAHAAELGGDGRRVAVGGDSAGGNLAAVVSLVARERGGPRLAFQLLVYPVTDAPRATGSYRDNAEGYLLTAADMECFFGHYVGKGDRQAPHVTPIAAADLAGLPPALVVTAEYDPLRDEGEAYATRLQQAGVPVTLSRYPGMIHGFFGMGEFVEKSRAAVAEAAAALRGAFARG